MKILFTKKFDKAMISAKIGGHFSYDFVEAIQIKPLQIEKIDVKGKSLIFTSANAVESFFNNQIQAEASKIYAVGSVTEKALKKRGLHCCKVAKNAAELSEYILEKNADEEFLHFCGTIALDTISKNLALHHISYTKIPVYETELLYPKVSADYDAVSFFSPSGVRSFAKFNSLDHVQLFSIGETTTAEVKKFTKNTVITSNESNLEDLLNLISLRMNTADEEYNKKL